MKKKEDREKVFRPPELLSFQDAQITVTEDRQVLIENYRGILLYTSSQIVVLTAHQKIRIQGKYMKILYYTKEEMKVSGKIFSITYLE